ncbi:MAG: hypothetical protein Q7R39_18840 [Dehalococcoidia bacterium]|nr:hypothetical protein [Dehalococcoidia bacterium]
MSPSKDTKNRGQAKKHQKRPTARAPRKRLGRKPWMTVVGGALLVVIAIGAMVWAARPNATEQSRQVAQAGVPASSGSASDAPHVFYGST